MAVVEGGWFSFADLIENKKLTLLKPIIEFHALSLFSKNVKPEAITAVNPTMTCSIKVPINYTISIYLIYNKKFSIYEYRVSISGSNNNIANFISSIT